MSGWIVRGENWGGFAYDRRSGQYLKIFTSGILAIRKYVDRLALSNDEATFLSYLGKMGISLDDSSISLPQKEAGTSRLHQLPLEVLFYITTKCNRKCDFCYLGETIDRIDSPPNVVEAFLKNLDEAPIPVVAILGGEPLLHPRLPALLIHLLERTNSRVSLSTNGTISLGSLIEQIRPPSDGSFGVNLSLHSVEESDDLKRKLQAINLLSELKLPFSMTTVISRQNLNILVDIAQWIILHCNHSSLQDWTVAYMHPFGWANSICTPPKLEQAFSCRSGLQEYFLSCEEPPSFEVCYNIPFLFEHDKGPTIQSPLEVSLVGCSAYYSKLELLPDGNAYPCSYFFESDEYLMGNIRKHGLRKIWSNSPLHNIFTPGSDCPQACAYHNWCVGCPGARIRNFPNGTCSKVGSTACSY